MCYISKILKIESNSQPIIHSLDFFNSCVISQRYSKLKAIHNDKNYRDRANSVVLYLKDTQNWKQFTTNCDFIFFPLGCVISQRYSKLKAIHNVAYYLFPWLIVVLYLKDTQNWKQFTTGSWSKLWRVALCYISKILKIESNSQQVFIEHSFIFSCVISQRYSKLKAIHNYLRRLLYLHFVVLYLKDTQNWKQFTTRCLRDIFADLLCYISKILKIESNSQQHLLLSLFQPCCVISQRYSKLKAIHNTNGVLRYSRNVVLYLKDTQNWKQFTTGLKTFLQVKSLCYISKILKIESNSQRVGDSGCFSIGCVISQRYSKLKAIHNV